MSGPLPPSPILELIVLNQQMNNAGIFVGGCDLRFYSYNIVYAVKFGPSGAFNIEQFNKFVGSWQLVMFSGTLLQTTNTLNSFGPFLTFDQVIAYWGGFKVPPEPPAVNFEEIFQPV